MCVCALSCDRCVGRYMLSMPARESHEARSEPRGDVCLFSVGHMVQ